MSFRVAGAKMSEIDRRDFLRLTAVVVAGRATAACNDETIPYQNDPTVFPHSVASGDPRPDAVVLWTRAVDPDRPGDEVALEVARDQGFRDVVARAEGLAASAAHDHVVKVRSPTSRRAPPTTTASESVSVSRSKGFPRCTGAGVVVVGGGE
jgi:hypothetical protein